MTLADAWQNDRAVLPNLIRLATDEQQTEIVRATALQELGRYPDQSSYQVASNALQSADPRIRIAALRALEFVPPQNRQFLLPLINDPVKAVRMELARMLAPMPQEDLPQQLAPHLQTLYLEYIEAQQVNADMPGAQLNLGVMYASRGDPGSAEKAYDHALKLAPQFVPALLNLADLYRTMGRDWQARPLLERAIEIAPEQATVYHSMGLLQVRQKQVDEALPNLARAVELSPELSRYAYVYAVAVESTGELDKSLEVLEDALARHPGDYDLLNALVHYNDKAGKTERATQYREILEDLYPPREGR
jgi:tetratricopeptide (TPR) repeat protein